MGSNERVDREKVKSARTLRKNFPLDRRNSSRVNPFECQVRVSDRYQTQFTPILFQWIFETYIFLVQFSPTPWTRLTVRNILWDTIKNLHLSIIVIATQQYIYLKLGSDIFIRLIKNWVTNVYYVYKSAFHLQHLQLIYITPRIPFESFIHFIISYMQAQYKPWWEARLYKW